MFGVCEVCSGRATAARCSSLVFTNAARALSSTSLKVRFSNLVDDRRSPLTSLGSPLTRALFIQNPGCVSPTSHANRCNSVRNSSAVSSGRRRHVVNCLKATNESVPSAFIRARLISSTSSRCSLDSCRYVSQAAPFNRSGRTRSILEISQSSQVNSRSSNHSSIGVSVTAPLNSRISRTSNCLDAMVNNAPK